MRRHIFFGLLLLGIIVVSVAPVAAGEWVIRLFSWSRAPSQPTVQVTREHGYVDCSGTVWMETAPTCSGALYVNEAPSLCSGAAEDSDDDEDSDVDD